MIPLTFSLQKTSYDLSEQLKLSPSSPVSIVYVSNQHFTLYKNNNNSYIPVDITFDMMGADIIIVPNSSLESDEIYTIVIRDVYGDSDSYLESQILNFYTYETTPQRNVNDVYYQLENIGNINSFETILTDANYLNYLINPKIYDFNAGKYVAQLDSENNLVWLNMYNNDNVRDLMINQFINEYKTYLDDIFNYKQLPELVSILNAEVSAQEMVDFYQSIIDLNAEVLGNNPDALYDIQQYLITISNGLNQAFSSSYSSEEGNRQISNVTDEMINRLTLLIMNNITKFNALKGTQDLIEFVLGVYIKVLGYQLISVIPDGDQNFRYRVSCSLPTSLWRRAIRPIVHPAGWSDIYNYVSSILNGVEIDLGRDRRGLWKNNVSYLDAEYYNLIENQLKYKILDRFSHVNGNVEQINVIPHDFIDHDTCTLKNTLDHTQYDVDYAGSLSLLNYAVSGLYKEIYSQGLGSTFNIDYSSGNNLYDMGFGKPGIALEYLWKVYKNNTLVDIIRTPFETLSLDFNNKSLSNPTYSLNSREYQVILQLKHEGWTKEIYNFNSENLLPYKTIFQSWGIANSGRKFINTRNNYLLDGNMLNIGIASLETEYINTAITQNNIINYNFAVSGIDKFHSEFDYGPDIYSYSTSTVTGSAGTILTKVDVGYSPSASSTDGSYVIKGIGNIFDKYVWSVYQNDTLMQIIETQTNTVTAYIPQSSLSQYKISLVVYYNDTSYILNNQLNFL